MSRTHHHSYRWGKNHRWASRLGRSWKLTHSRIGEAPGWHAWLYDERPGRRGDKLLIHRIVCGFADVKDARFERTGGRKPHSDYW